MAWIPQQRTHHKGEWPSELLERDEERFKSLEDGEVAVARGTDGSTFVAIGRRETGRRGFQWVGLAPKEALGGTPFYLQLLTVIVMVVLLVTSFIGWKQTSDAVSKISRAVDSLADLRSAAARFSTFEAEMKKSQSETLAAISEQNAQILSLKASVESKFVDFTKQRDEIGKLSDRNKGSGKTGSSNSGGQVSVPDASGDAQGPEAEKARPSTDAKGEALPPRGEPNNGK